tara:strand:+ start:908 stop:1435 length:528 start_codon:yes stop_codon:yes gene_type:complete
MINKIKTSIKDSYLFKSKSIKDERGSFSRLFCKKEFKIKDNIIKQVNLSFNKKKLTLRGFHYQEQPFSEGKYMYLLQGSIQFILIDLRKNSNSYLKRFSKIIKDKDNYIIFIPKGCANAFLTLESNSKILYFMTEFYKQNLAKGIRYDDPFFKVKWKHKPLIISKRDKKFPLFRK